MLLMKTDLYIHLCLSLIVPPYFIVQPSNISIVVSKNISLPCKIAGSPTPIVHWSFINLMGRRMTLSHQMSSSVNVYENGLFITTISKSLEGWYSCSASNIAGRIRAEVFLRVFGMNLDSSITFICFLYFTRKI